MVPDTCISTSSLNIGFWNINGNLAFKTLDPHFVRFARKLHVLIVIESKLKPSDHIDFSTLGFTTIARNERRVSSGGVLIAIKHELVRHSKVLINDMHMEQIYLKLFDKLVIGAVYIPPRESSYFAAFDRFEYMNDCIGTISSKALQYVIVGDFNARVGRSVQTFFDSNGNVTSNVPISSADSTVNRSGRSLLDICSETHSIILTGKSWGPAFTCFQPRGTSVVDTGIAPPSLLNSISNGCLHPLSLSDHTPISFEVKIEDTRDHKPVHSKRKEIVPRRLLKAVLVKPDTVLRLQNDICASPVVQAFADRVKNVFFTNKVLSKQDLSYLVRDMYSVFETCLDSTFNRKRPKDGHFKTRNNRSFRVEYDDTCRMHRAAFRRVERVFRKSPSDSLYIVYRNRLKLKLSHERRCRRRSEKQYLARILKPKNSVHLWKEIRNSSPVSYDGPISKSEYSEFLREIAEGKFDFDENISKRRSRVSIPSVSCQVCPWICRMPC